MKSKWISVKDRLPLEIKYGLSKLEEVYVLATDGFTVASIAFQRGHGGGIPWAEFSHYCNELSHLSITHWMPLPGPPKEEEVDK